MDAGQCVEFDTPLNLINKKDSAFNKLVQATGKEMTRTLRRMAKEIQLLRSVGSSRLEINEKIQETITVIKEDENDSDLDDELDVDEDNLSSLNQLLDGVPEPKKDKNEFTRF